MRRSALSRGVRFVPAITEAARQCPRRRNQSAESLGKSRCVGWYRGCDSSCRARMASDVTIVIADPARVVAIREGASLPGRVMSFTSASLGSAFESIRAYRPKTVAIDAIFAETPPGAAFIDRVEALATPGRSILFLAEDAGRWVTLPRNMAKMVTAPKAAAATPLVIAPRPEPVNTRRAPRFLVKDPIDVSVESG